MVEGKDNDMDDTRTRGQLIGTNLKMFVHDYRPQSLRLQPDHVQRNLKKRITKTLYLGNNSSPFGIGPGRSSIVQT